MFETRDNSQTPNNNLESGLEDNENIKHLNHSRSRDLYNEVLNNNIINDFQRQKKGFENMNNINY
jgi:hypothetical protein